MSDTFTVVHRDLIIALAAQYRLPAVSAFGTKRTSESAQPMSVFGGKADIARTLRNVSF
jgi:hypothetical protein